jgi:hypothetical protein
MTRRPWHPRLIASLLVVVAEAVAVWCWYVH